MNSKGIIIVISGFSGVGKGTIMKGLTSKYDQYALSISATTRKPRPGEVDGQSYFFVSQDEFKKLIDEDGLIEHACYVDNYYGTPRKYVEDKLNAGKDVILEIELQGARQIKERYKDSISIFVMPPSAGALKERLEGRGTEAADVIKKRLSKAVEESEGIEEYDYIVVNDDLEQCIEMTHDIIQSAHYKADRNIDFIDDVRGELRKLYAQ